MNDFNATVIDEFRANGGNVSGVFEGMPMVLLTHTGAKSGVQRTTPLVHSMDGDKVVVAASMGGAPTNPAWYHNMVAHPEVTVEHGTAKYQAIAREATGAERDRLYAQQAKEMPQFAEYQSNTDRVIPVFVLEPIA
ncbi:MAG: nitroreductase family deazaflavin-dependent oxidoreductase [Ilumatobacteraceae bacterium]|nr:nitroreductase family deazaflavin-dependent oxidoreductase [Ilumatobacteraceae bacterium]